MSRLVNVNNYEAYFSAGEDPDLDCPMSEAWCCGSSEEQAIRRFLERFGRFVGYEYVVRKNVYFRKRGYVCRSSGDGIVGRGIIGVGYEKRR